MQRPECSLTQFQRAMEGVNNPTLLVGGVHLEDLGHVQPRGGWSNHCTKIRNDSPFPLVAKTCTRPYLNSSNTVRGRMLLLVFSHSDFTPREFTTVIIYDAPV